MKYPVVTCAFLIIVAAPLAAQEGAQPLSLDRAYGLARERNETVLEQSEKIRQSRARARQALGAALPDISFKSSNLIQDVPKTSSSDGSVGGTLTRRTRPESKFTLEQPLFSGFQESSAFSAFRAEARREEHNLRHESQRLYLDVATAFYTVILLERDLANAHTVLGLAQERVKELNRRSQLGKSRRSEVLSVESQLATLRAEARQTEGDLAVARQNLSYLLGQDAASWPLEDGMPDPLPPKPQENFLAKAGQRADVRAQTEDVLSNRYKLRIARGGLWPSADLTGNYYTYRVGFQKEIDWDLLLSLTVPIFRGGTQAAAVRESASVLAESKLELSRVRRDAEREIQTAAIRLAASVGEREAFQEAYEKAQESYKLHAQEYRLGLVNNLEVLEALNRLQEDRRQWDRSVVQSKLNLLGLKIATEELP